MLRLLVALLLIANIGYATWSQGWLDGRIHGLPSSQPTREPNRLLEQVEPHRIALHATVPTTGTATPSTPSSQETPSVAAASTSDATSTQATPTLPGTAPATGTAADSPTRCVQVTALHEKQLAVLRIALLATQPDGGWEVQQTVQTARWIVYSGKLATPAALNAKRAELRLLGVDFRDVQVPALQPGLAMGTYSTESAAQQALKELSRTGVRGAKVVQERAEAQLATVQWPAASDLRLSDTVTLLQRLGPEGLEGKQLQPCP